jgi:hypothetical protein
MATLVETLARDYLGGDLAPDAYEALRGIDDEVPEKQDWVRRIFQRMEQARFRPQDFSIGMASLMATTGPPQLAWDGMIPPVTSAGRHAHLDDYLESNLWHSVSGGDRILDVGCGFPPLTTVDVAARFSECSVLGIDVAFGRYLVFDEQGDYACFNAASELFYFQDPAFTPERMQALRRDRAGTVARFSALRDQLEPLLPEGDYFAEAHLAGARIVRNPVAGYETENLRFRSAGIGEAGLPQADIIRCMQVLWFFDAAWQDRARQWFLRTLSPGGILTYGQNAAGSDSRCFIWQRDGEALVPREFALSPDNLRPTLGVLPWAAIHEDDREAPTRAAVIGAIWDGNEGFRREFDEALDHILADLSYQARRPDGFLGAMPIGWTATQLTATRKAVNDRLDAEGWTERAAEQLREKGYHAWRNTVGDLAIDPLEWGWEPTADRGETP